MSLLVYKYIFLKETKEFYASSDSMDPNLKWAHSRALKDNWKYVYFMFKTVIMNNLHIFNTFL